MKNEFPYRSAMTSAQQAFVKAFGVLSDALFKKSPSVRKNRVRHAYAKWSMEEIDLEQAIDLAFGGKEARQKQDALATKLGNSNLTASFKYGTACSEIRRQLVKDAEGILEAMKERKLVDSKLTVDAVTLPLIDPQDRSRGRGSAWYNV
jgi:7-keto-8-aminopelargonate synthetase-like enzyme